VACCCAKLQLYLFIFLLTEQKVEGKVGEEVTWSLMAPRANDNHADDDDDEAVGSTVVCVNAEDEDKDAHQPAAAETATTETRPVGDGSDMIRYAGRHVARLG